MPHTVLLVGSDERDDAVDRLEGRASLFVGAQRTPDLLFDEHRQLGDTEGIENVVDKRGVAPKLVLVERNEVGEDER
ncbi:hypothetical protein ACS2QP_28145, partial [Bacillus cereus group sp. Bce019]|uniref:hypothetical protein n=1 Tax=Bacillus cereus group sp. Bce019 TaxID=3445247 RepID=UPI003F26DF00